MKTEGVAVRAYGVTGWRNGLLKNDFSCVFQSQVSGEEARRLQALRPVHHNLS